MLTDPSEEGACASQKISKQWLTEHLSVMKEEITKDVTQKVLAVVNERLSEVGDKSDKTDEAAAASKETATSSKNENKVLHMGVFCDNCDAAIYGIRYKCRDCKDFDLCEACESIPDLHDVKHVFLKIRHPISPCFFAAKKKHAKDVEGKIVIKGLGRKKLSKTENMLSPVKSKEDYCGEMHAVFVCDETVPDGTFFLPGTKFMKRWRVRNLSGHSWNSYTTVRMIYSQPAFQPLHTEVAAPRINPFEEGVVSVQFTAPKTPGHYESHWELHHMDIPFGDVLWCKVIVSDSATATVLSGVTGAPELSSSARIPLGKNWRICEYPQLRLKRKSKEEKRKKKDHEKRKVSHIFEVLSLAQEETEDGNLCPRKCVTSHTATPNNTPFDLTPPKSPEPKEIIDAKKENSVLACNDINTVETVVPDLKVEPDIRIPLIISESDDKVSFSSISSSESDNEFVVIPMPKCFNLSEPFIPSQGLFSSEAGSPNIVASHAPTPMNIMDNAACQKVANLEKVSQETGVPEQPENLVICEPVRQISERCYVVSNIVRLSESPSSSSISVIDSDPSSPTSEIPHLVEVEARQDLVQKAELSRPVVETISEAEHASGTFPKFPVEGIEADTISTYSGVLPTEDGERTIQVLPEGLVTGALLAAATVYNTARGIISSIQPVKNDQEESAEERQAGAVGDGTESTPEILSSMEQLIEMGFCNIEQNAYLLQKCNGNVTKVVEELVSFQNKNLR